MKIFEASLKFGGPGHNGEYTVRVDEEETPYVARQLQQILIGWNVCTVAQGSRSFRPFTDTDTATTTKSWRPCSSWLSK